MFLVCEERMESLMKQIGSPQDSEGLRAQIQQIMTSLLQQVQTFAKTCGNLQAAVEPGNVSAHITEITQLGE